VRLVLASASPRRAELLSAAGFSFVVQPVEIDETPRPGEDAAALVVRLATEKAGAIAAADDEVILAADTVVVADGEILGKPVDDEDAASMLRRLSGRSHEVVTGVAVLHGASLVTAVERTRVHVSALQRDEIAWYVRSGEPGDKAGAYGIQGLASRFIERIDGSYTNVVGLPVATVRRVLRSMALDALLA
jgi:septum formation protein